jgi:hypothetical protein
MLCRSLLLVAGLCITQSAAAVCYYQGRPYPTGARVGQYVCQPDGTWRKVARQLLPIHPFDTVVRGRALFAPAKMRVW